MFSAKERDVFATNILCQLSHSNLTEVRERIAMDTNYKYFVMICGDSEHALELNGGNFPYKGGLNPIIF